ncbi:semaphorin-4E [Callorhinchus milii]|uniref:semaphorin-4E n=1 Tax=Callorhinchus milii TaxID=7868 RepID=UPI00045719AE|nr:semaphorin-4E [Callorhinchus milii]|eukprot:gi/632961811/ref/XP_007896966.1/ PREDICTED: semaphorin-4E-like [Callorhinchus milii]
MCSSKTHKTAVFLCVHLFVEHLLHSQASVLDSTPRRSVNYKDAKLKTFTEKGLSNVSSLLLSEEHKLLIVGARDAIFALNIEDISKTISQEAWPAPEANSSECEKKGKSRNEDCRNYIVGIHRVTENNLYVCGTHAFHPMCDYMTVDNGKIQLKRQPKFSKGKAPYDPKYTYTSIVVDGELYSATENNFLGSQPIFQRSLKDSSLRTENIGCWLKNPNFVYVDVVRESEDSPEGDEDKIYLFFSEVAIEYNFKSEVLISRVARVCKGDKGGQRILQRKWSSFVKAGLECNFPKSNYPFNVIQDVFLLRAPKWRDNIFYATFTSQWSLQNNSAVCTFTMAAIQKVFNEGNFKTFDIIHHKMMESIKPNPVPRPGTCINNNLTKSGYKTSLDLPDQTLLFLQTHPLLNDVVMPKDNQPVLVKQATIYTQIVVHRVTATDQKQYNVIFLGTDKGYLHKALSITGKMFIVEEVQIFPSEEPVKNLQISPTRGQLYISSPSQVVQVPVAVCSQHKTCWDCVLARDPYCAWDTMSRQCLNIASKDSKGWIQNVENGDASECPSPRRASLQYQVIILKHSDFLKCHSTSNLAQKEWLLNGEKLPTDNSKYIHIKDGLLILNLSRNDKGQYDCQAVEMTNGKKFTHILASYSLLLRESRSVHLSRPAMFEQPNWAPNHKSGVLSTAKRDISTFGARQPNLLVTQRDLRANVTVQSFLVLFVIMFGLLLTWNIWKGHVPFQWMKCIPSSHVSIKQSPASLLKSSVQKLGTKMPLQRKLVTPGNQQQPRNNLQLMTIASENSFRGNCTSSTTLVDTANSSCSRPLFILDDQEYFDAEEPESNV